VQQVCVASLLRCLLWLTSSVVLLLLFAPSVRPLCGWSAQPRCRMEAARRCSAPWIRVVSVTNAFLHAHATRCSVALRCPRTSPVSVVPDQMAAWGDVTCWAVSFSLLFGQQSIPDVSC
jgi:hypothetical protein